MSYTLCLGFKTVLYQNSPQLRLFLNDIFLDEFNIEKNFNTTLDNTDLYSHKKLEYQYNAPKTKYWLDQNIHMRYYKINLEHRKNKLDFYLKSNSNNYTNGFMTKFTCVQFCIAFLLPSEALSEPGVFVRNYKKVFQADKNSLTTESDIKNFYIGKPFLCDILTPFYSTQPLYFQKGQKPRKIYRNEWIGGEGHFSINFDKETLCNVHSHKKNTTFIEPPMIFALANKYLEYENLRNNN